MNEIPITPECDTRVSVVNRLDYYYKLFDLTNIFYYSDYGWAVALPEKIPNAEIITSIFQLTIWIGIFLIFILITIIIWLARAAVHKQSKLSDCILIVYGITFNEHYKKSVKSTTIRVTTNAYTLFVIVLAAVFQGKLSSLLTTPVLQTQVNSVAEMADSNMVPVLYDFVYKQYENLNYPVLQKITDKAETIKINGHIRFQQISSGNISTPLYKTTLAYRPELRSKIKLIGTDFLLNMEALFDFRKDYPFLESFNAVIEDLHEFGIVRKIEKFVLNVKNEENGISVTTLSFYHVEGSFYILAGGCTVGLVAFLCEIIIYYCKKYDN